MSAARLCCGLATILVALSCDRDDPDPSAKGASATAASASASPPSNPLVVRIPPAEELPVIEDFVIEAERDIDEKNYEAELARIAKEIEKVVDMPLFHHP